MNVEAITLALSSETALACFLSNVLFCQRQFFFHDSQQIFRLKRRFCHFFTFRMFLVSSRRFSFSKPLSDQVSKTRKLGEGLKNITLIQLLRQTLGGRFLSEILDEAFNSPLVCLTSFNLEFSKGKRVSRHQRQDMI